MSRIRVLVAEDSLTVRKRMVEIFTADPELEVVGEAASGEEAVDLCSRFRPDILTLDLVLPMMNGVEATETIMAHCPTPILIVSDPNNRGERFKTLDALSAGALDALDKNAESGPEGEWERTLVSRVKMLSRIKVITHPRGKLAPTPPKGLAPRQKPSLPSTVGPLLVIGASTGGPAAIRTVLRRLPSDFPLPILLVIHLGKPFGINFAEWLNEQTSLRVTQAVDDSELPGPGEVVVAQADMHLLVHQGRIRLSTSPERNFCRPSVDVLFESVAAEVGRDCVACLLTGMGKDGAEGLLAIRRAGGLTLAQDEATSAIYGMPRAAAQLDAAELILPLDQFAPTLRRVAEARVLKS